MKKYHFEYIKSIIKTKKQEPSNKGDLLAMLNAVIKSLLGRNVVKTKKN